MSTVVRISSKTVNGQQFAEFVSAAHPHLLWQSLNEELGACASTASEGKATRSCKQTVATADLTNLAEEMQHSFQLPDLRPGDCKAQAHASMETRLLAGV